MAKKPGTNPKGEFAFFNVVYEDDSQRSNRRVPSELLGGLDGDEPKTLQEIGDELGLTRERIRQLEKNLVDGLRDYMKANLVDFEYWSPEG